MFKLKDVDRPARLSDELRDLRGLTGPDAIPVLTITGGAIAGGDLAVLDLADLRRLAAANDGHGTNSPA